VLAATPRSSLSPTMAPYYPSSSPRRHSIKLHRWADDASLEESNDDRSTLLYLDVAHRLAKPSIASRVRPASLNRGSRLHNRADEG
jgi:hypothetical protein